MLIARTLRLIRFNILSFVCARVERLSPGPAVLSIQLPKAHSLSHEHLWSKWPWYLMSSVNTCHGRARLQMTPAESPSHFDPDRNCAPRPRPGCIAGSDWCRLGACCKSNCAHHSGFCISASCVSSPSWHSRYPAFRAQWGRAFPTWTTAGVSN